MPLNKETNSYATSVKDSDVTVILCSHFVFGAKKNHIASLPIMLKRAFVQRHIFLATQYKDISENLLFC